jgi:hypothetical protein
MGEGTDVAAESSDMVSAEPRSTYDVMCDFVRRY